MPIKHALTCPAQSIACQFCFKSKSIEEGITKPRYIVLKFKRYLNQGAVECLPYSLNYQLIDECKCCKISDCLMKVYMYKIILLFKCWLIQVSFLVDSHAGNGTCSPFFGDSTVLLLHFLCGFIFSIQWVSVMEEVVTSTGMVSVTMKIRTLYLVESTNSQVKKNLNLRSLFWQINFFLKQ